MLKVRRVVFKTPIPHEVDSLLSQVVEPFSVALERVVIKLALHGAVRRHLLRLHPVIFLLRIIDQQRANDFYFATWAAVDLLVLFELVRHQILHRW